MKIIKRSYSELCKFESYEDRFEYLKLDGTVGRETFGYDRYLNQMLYQSPLWKRVRDYVIARDLGCDLGIEGHTIYSTIYVHHMNAITIEDIETGNPDVFNPEYLICTMHRTHQAIHYGDKSLLPSAPIERKSNDTSPWK